MHTYALPVPCCCAPPSPCWFYRSACAFKRTLLCHKRYNSRSSPSATTEDGVCRPPTVHVNGKSAANIRGICLKCRKGRGPRRCSDARPGDLCSIFDTLSNIPGQHPPASNPDPLSFIFIYILSASLSLGIFNKFLKSTHRFGGDAHQTNLLLLALYFDVLFLFVVHRSG